MTEPIKPIPPVAPVASGPVKPVAPAFTGLGKKESPEVKVKSEVEVRDKTEADKTEEECEKILAEHGGQESNIPVHHGYWNMRNMVRAARNK